MLLDGDGRICERFYASCSVASLRGILSGYVASKAKNADGDGDGDGIN